MEPDLFRALLKCSGEKTTLRKKTLMSVEKNTTVQKNASYKNMSSLNRRLQAASKELYLAPLHLDTLQTPLTL